MSRLSSVRSARDEDDYSIVLQTARNFDLLLSPPEIEIAPREYSQRADNTNLPDGSILSNGLIGPIGETLDKNSARLSRRAYEAWMLWTKIPENPEEANIPTTTGETIEPIKKKIEFLLLTQEEHLYYTRIKRLMIKEKLTYKEEHTRYQKRLIEESRGIRGTQVSNIERNLFTPSHAERLANINLSDHETNRWRKAIRSETDNYIPNIGPEDDPDFINPSNISSRNFNIYPPSFRPYNIVYRIYYNPDPNYDPPPDGEWDDDKCYKSIKKLYPKKGQKDYTSVSSIEYMLTQRGWKDFKVVIDHLNTSKNKENRTYKCRWEVDLRVTYNKDMVPNPNEYKKVDPESKLGMRLLQLLNEQPYLYIEFVWEHEVINKEGKKEKEKKVAVGFQLNTKEGPRVYWVYLHREKGQIVSTPLLTLKGKLTEKELRDQIINKKVLRTLRKKKVPPQYNYIPFQYYKQDHPNYLKREAPFLATVRVSPDYSYFDREQGRYINFPEVKQRFIEILNSKGYELFNEDFESYYNNIFLFKFIHVDAKTKQQRYAHFRELDAGNQND